MHITILLQTALAAVTTAHFLLDYPVSRGFDEDTLGTFPCGGQNTISTNRTLFPLSGGSIALTMADANASIEVLIGYGSDVGSAFNTVLRPTFNENGTGTFCMTGFEIPAGMEGMNATIQVSLMFSNLVNAWSGADGEWVVTSGDDEDPGLYNCADVTLSSSAAAVASSICMNATTVSVSAAIFSGNPNVTDEAVSTSGAIVGKSFGVGGMLVVVGAAVLFGFAL